MRMYSDYGPANDLVDEYAIVGGISELARQTRVIIAFMEFLGKLGIKSAPEFLETIVLDDPNSEYNRFQAPSGRWGITRY